VIGFTTFTKRGVERGHARTPADDSRFRRPAEFIDQVSDFARRIRVEAGESGARPIEDRELRALAHVIGKIVVTQTGDESAQDSRRLGRARSGFASSRVCRSEIGLRIHLCS
jgi:hypothetical protein